MKKIGILTGGGDVHPLNSVIYSAAEEAEQEGFELIGFRYGWQGILEKNYIEISTDKINSQIGGTILKSSRVNLRKVLNGARIVEENLSKIGIDGLIVIGGEDTLSNSFLLPELSQVLISKTIDNDVGIVSNDKIINYFTLGHPTAAETISNFVSLDSGLRTTAYSHERIIIVESMGMHAGWLALSSAMGNPDFVILPEFGIDFEVLKERVAERFVKEKNVIVVVAEGAKWINGQYLSADENEKDSFGHPRFKGAASVLGELLKKDLKKYFDTRNVNWVNPSYLYRSGKPNDLDFSAAKMLGKRAVSLLKEEKKSRALLTTNYDSGNLGIGELMIDEYNDIEEIHRFVPENFYDKNNFNVTSAGISFLSKILNQHKQIKYGF